MKKCEITERRGVVVQTPDDHTHVLIGHYLAGDIRLNDQVTFSMDTGPWTEDFVARGRVVGVVAHAHECYEDWDDDR